ncbi:MAG: type 4b pilus protein PilO2 [Bdellovibrionales bacterium]|jgi:hypothetical protein
MAAGVVTVGRHRYAVGLYWENSPGKGRVAQIAKEAAEQPGQQADFYVVRAGNKEGRVPQFGLCSKGGGQEPGMPVLAACLAAQIPGAWAGAFRLNEGVVLIIVRDDLIVPDGDLFFREEAEARDRLIQEIGYGGLQTIYAPEAWSIPGADTIPLTLLLNDQADIQLQQVTLSPKVKIAIAGAAAAFVLILGIVWYMQNAADEELARQQQLALIQAQQAAGMSSFGQTPPPEPKYERTWESTPPVLAVIKACKEGLDLVPSAVSGWNLSALSCNGLGINLSWQRTKGETAPPKGSSVNDTGATAVQTLPLPPLQPRGNELLKNIDEITNRYLLQNWPGSISRAPDDPLPPPPEGYTGPWNPPPAPWVKRSFTLNVAELPGGLPGFIGDLPGAIINSMSFSRGGGASAWVVEGVIYENRK